MYQLPPKMPNIEEKKPNNFFAANCLQKSQICEIWRQKANLVTLFMPCSFSRCHEIPYRFSIMLQAPVMCFFCCTHNLYIAGVPNTFWSDPKK